MKPTISIEHVERFLRVRTAGRQGAETETSEASPHPFVTISRQSGAGGHTLAETMLGVFQQQQDSALFRGWQVFDQRLCEIVAEDLRLAGSLDALLTEAYRSRAEEFFHQLFQPQPDMTYVMDRVFRTVRALAGVGNVIIVGRAGSEVTKDMAAGYALRLVAPEVVRIRRMMEREKVDESRARDETRRSDASRARLLKRHFGVDIDDPLRYDATFNTEAMSLEAISEAVAVALRHRVAKPT